MISPLRYSRRRWTRPLAAAVMAVSLIGLGCDDAGDRQARAVQLEASAKRAEGISVRRILGWDFSA